MSYMNETPLRSVKSVSDEKYVNQSLTRGLQILDCFGADDSTLSLAELGARTGLSQATTFRLAATLTKLGYLSQDARTKRYQLGIKVLSLGNAFLMSIRFPQVALPILEQAAQRWNEAVNMSILDGREIVYVTRIAVKRIIATNFQVGSRLPAHCTSMGKVLLAFRPREEVEELYAGVQLEAFTDRTIDSLSALQDALEKVRRDGFAVNDEELEYGLRSVAAPVWNAAGEVIAAVNISVAAGRVSLESLHSQFMPHIRRTADEISARLGYGLMTGHAVVHGSAKEHVLRPAPTTEEGT